MYPCIPACLCVCVCTHVIFINPAKADLESQYVSKRKLRPGKLNNVSKFFMLWNLKLETGKGDLHTP